ncbi:MAG: glycosyltransferase family A protein [Armatimonadota bacterium]
MNDIKITFGIIVLNGEPFTRYNLRSLYPYAHQIIVVEGACPGAKNIATPEGHSRDGTLEILHRFKKEEDPENKIAIVTAEDEGHPNGFWTEKDEMSQAYAKRATGNYLWQVDIDEFYIEKDVEKIINILENDPSITAVSFKQVSFFGALDYSVNSYYLKNGAEIYHRLFKWGKGYTYVTHRPPTVHNEKNINLRDINYLSGYDLEKQNIVMYHYSLLFPKQVQEKCDYYSNADWANRKKALDWAHTSYFQLKKPYRVHNVYEYISWLEKFNGQHPKQALSMISDIKNKKTKAELRQTQDIEKLINSTNYKVGTSFLKAIYPLHKKTHPFYVKWSGRLKTFIKNPLVIIKRSK